MNSSFFINAMGRIIVAFGKKAKPPPTFRQRGLAFSLTVVYSAVSQQASCAWQQPPPSQQLAAFGVELVARVKPKAVASAAINRKYFMIFSCLEFELNFPTHTCGGPSHLNRGRNAAAEREEDRSARTRDWKYRPSWIDDRPDK